MDENKKFTAKQASELAESKKQSIEEILEIIVNYAMGGNRFMMIVNLPSETMIELINLGYTVSKYEDQFGIEHFKIKW